MGWQSDLQRPQVVPSNLPLFKFNHVKLPFFTKYWQSCIGVETLSGSRSRCLWFDSTPCFIGPDNNGNPPIKKMLNLSSFKLFLSILHLGNNENPPITDEICWSLDFRYCGAQLYFTYRLSTHASFSVHFAYLRLVFSFLLLSTLHFSFLLFTSPSILWHVSIGLFCSSFFWNGRKADVGVWATKTRVTQLTCATRRMRASRLTCAMQNRKTGPRSDRRG